MTHVPNRRGLDPSETTALDAVMHAYNTTRDRARSEFIAAQTAYLAVIKQAAEDRDAGILTVVDAAASRGRGTQSRVAEYLKMNVSYLSGRLKKARGRRGEETMKALPA